MDIHWFLSFQLRAPCVCFSISHLWPYLIYWTSRLLVFRCWLRAPSLNCFWESNVVRRFAYPSIIGYPAGSSTRNLHGFPRQVGSDEVKSSPGSFSTSSRCRLLQSRPELTSVRPGPCWAYLDEHKASLSEWNLLLEHETVHYCASRLIRL